MKKILKPIVIGALLFSTAFAFSGFTDVAKADTAEKAVVQSSQGVPGAFSVGIRHGSYLNADVHEQAYLTFLLKEYAPDSEAEWKEAFVERKKVTAEIKEKLKELAPGEEISVNGDKIKYFVAKPAAPNAEGSTLPVPQIKEFVTILKDDAALPSGERKDIIFKAGEFAPDKLDQKLMDELKAEAELQAAFAKAVESGDADAIGAVLPKILEDYKQKTEQLKKVPETIQFKVIDRENKSE